MATEHTQKTEEMQPETVKFLSLGGEEDVTRNMYIYEHKDQILLVDCGLGFPDETMLGVDLLLRKRCSRRILKKLCVNIKERYLLLPILPMFPV